MDFNDTPEENNFRLEVREWLKNNAPKDKKSGGYDSIDVQESALARARDWQALKAKAGYAAITWPKEYGGLGGCLLYTSPSPRDATLSRMPSSA